MACCGQRGPAPRRKAAFTAATPNMLYSTDQTTITGLDSRQQSLQSVLIRAPGRPSGGWRAALPINGQSVPVGGTNPVECYNMAVVALARNGVRVKPVDLWTSLNIQWMKKTPAKYHKVPLEDLLQIAKPPGAETAKALTVVDPRRRSYKPADWGHLAWGWLNIFLAREEFHFRDFLLQLRFVLDLLNPNTNPEIGCSDCFRDFGIEVEKVARRPGMTRQEAREWTVRVHNQVNAKLGKPQLTFDQAAKAAFWV